MKKFWKNTLCLLLAALLLLSMTACGTAGNGGEEMTTVPTEPAPVVDPVADNYRTYYQIFVGSFSDANNDGIGDLRGIINRFDYLNDGDINSGKSLGVQGIWLSPIFSSPSYHKYDAKDYYKIDWRFGTEEDLKELIALCKERNVQLILDLAINHSSSQHP
jgi:1,4-alpha-glucan branching enzyme